MNRNTRQRRLILELVQNNRTHPTADEVYEMARKSSPNLSRGTVYRNLGILVETGMLRRHSLSEGPDRFDCVLQEHYHFLCRKCHRITDIPFVYNDGISVPLPELPGYQVEEHTLMFKGLCPDCSRSAT